MTEPRVHDRRIRAIHWMIAGMLVGMLPMGWWLASLGGPSDASRTAYQAHALGGAIVFLLAMTRLWARWTATRLGPPEGMGPGHRKLVVFIHGALYSLTIVLCSSGLGALAAGELFPFLSGQTAPVAPSEAPPPLVAHRLFGWALMTFVAAHVAGVIRYQLRTGDVLSRMGIGKPSAD